jgi:predicted nucleotidyltransferase
LAALADLPGLAAAISRDLESAGVRHAVSGAVAMAVHGYVRATQDLDVLVLVSDLELPRVFEVVRRHGFAGDDRELVRQIRDRYVAALRSDPVTVEILVPVLPYHREVLDRASVRDVGGASVPFVTVEDLVVLKMLWRRAKDLADVHALLASQETLDADHIRGKLAEILPADDSRHEEIDELLRRLGPKPGGS